MLIGQAIKKVRETRGMSQNELASSVFSSQTNISRIESGAQKPSRKMLDKICHSLQVPVVVMQMLALEESDTPVNKQHHFREMKPIINSIIYSLWLS